MLIRVDAADIYSCDDMRDIEDNYKELVGNLIAVKSEKEMYMVMPKTRKGHGVINEIPGGYEMMGLMKEKHDEKHG